MAGGAAGKLVIMKFSPMLHFNTGATLVGDLELLLAIATDEDGVRVIVHALAPIVVRENGLAAVAEEEEAAALEMHVVRALDDIISARLGHAIGLFIGEAHLIEAVRVSDPEDERDRIAFE